MKLTPAYSERALVLRGDEETLLVGDLHIGLEVQLRQEGVRIPSQTHAMRQRIVELLEKHGCSRLVVLGDLKHTIPYATEQEALELRRFFDGMPARVDLVPGNHDAGIGFLSDAVAIHPATGIVLGGVGLSHGHVWPSPEVMACKEIVTCHNHPSVLLMDELGHKHREPCWVRGPLSRKARDRYPGVPRGARFVVMPNFNDLLGGVAFNALEREEYLGPLIRNGLFDAEKARIHTLDGIDLGTVAQLRRFARNDDV